MFGQRPFSVREAGGKGCGTVALGSGWGSGLPGSHCTQSDCRGCLSELTLCLPVVAAATSSLADGEQSMKTDTGDKAQQSTNINKSRQWQSFRQVKGIDSFMISWLMVLKKHKIVDFLQYGNLIKMQNST